VILTDGIATAMTRFNRQHKPEDPAGARGDKQSWDSDR
jgi:hypothetical protein